MVIDRVEAHPAVQSSLHSLVFPDVAFEAVCHINGQQRLSPSRTQGAVGCMAQSAPLSIASLSLYHCEACHTAERHACCLWEKILSACAFRVQQLNYSDNDKPQHDLLRLRFCCTAAFASAPGNRLLGSHSLHAARTLPAKQQIMHYKVQGPSYRNLAEGRGPP